MSDGGVSALVEAGRRTLRAEGLDPFALGTRASRDLSIDCGYLVEQAPGGDGFVVLWQERGQTRPHAQFATAEESVSYVIDRVRQLTVPSSPPVSDAVRQRMAAVAARTLERLAARGEDHDGDT